MEQLAYHLVVINWRAGKRILIACESNDQAKKIDHGLWAKTPTAFIPHNLVGEGPKDGAPVEICWPHQYNYTPRDLIINLLPKCTDFIFSFNEIIDFIPDEEFFKQLARNRYKAYRNVGFQLTITKPTIAYLSKV